MRSYTNAFKEYIDDVKSNKFPVDGEHTYKMKQEEIDLLEKRLAEEIDK